MIKAVSFQGSQPPVENKEQKKTRATAGVVVGALAGVGVAKYTNLGKVPQFAEADTFMMSSKEEITEATKDIAQEDEKVHVETLTKEKELLETKAKAVDSDLEKIFGKDVSELEVTKVLDGLEGKPVLADLQAVVKDGDAAIVAKETQLEEIIQSAKTLTAENPSEIVGEQKLDAEVIKVVKGATDNDPTTMEKGKMVKSTLANAKEADLMFQPLEGSKVEIKAHAETVTKSRAEFTAKKLIVDKLNITDKSAVTDKIKKENVKELLEESSKSISQEAKTAFESIKEFLPKHVSGKMIAIYAAAGAVIGGIIGHMIKKKED